MYWRQTKPDIILTGAKKLTTEIMQLVRQEIQGLENTSFTKSKPIISDYFHPNIEDQAQDPDKPLLFIHSTISREGGKNLKTIINHWNYLTLMVGDSLSQDTVKFISYYFNINFLYFLFLKDTMLLSKQRKRSDSKMVWLINASQTIMSERPL